MISGMTSGIELYKNENGVYILELWGGSTKHPDVVYSMADFKMAEWVDKSDPAQVDTQVFQWLLECASKLNFPMTAKDIAEYAIKNWCVWEK